jgi:hypothetical protein
MGGNGRGQQPLAHTSLRSKTAAPRHLSAAHWGELVDGSGIAPSVAAANFCTFGDGFADAEAERLVLLAEAFAQLNPQPGHSYQARMRLAWRYGHLDLGGWRFVGAALPGHSATPRWKPNQPRYGSNGKAIKYEAQPKRRPGLLLPQVPVVVWRSICRRHGLPFPADRSGGFWAWALTTPELPLTITEGEKKACALIGLGIAAIGLPGVEMGRVVERDANGEALSEALVPELQALACAGRRFTIAFDADEKASTAFKVERAAIRLGHLLVAAGAAVGIARVPLLFGEAKTGIDDLLVAMGRDAVLQALADALALAEVAWEQRYRQQRRIAPAIALPGGSLPLDLELPADRLIGIRAPKGAGKTKALERWLAERPQVLAITHRRSLGSAMANRLDLVWRNDTDAAAGRTFDANGNCWEGLPPRYALCIDSLLAIPPEAFAGAALVLDEAEQLLAHLLTSATCREQRGLLIQRLQQLCLVAGQVVALDADLSDATLQWLASAAGGVATSCSPCLIEATGQQRHGWRVHWYAQGKPDEAQAALIAAANASPVFVTTDSRERAEALHQLLQHHHPQGHGLLITSHTTGTPEMGPWLAKLTNAHALADSCIQWVVASPSISSGLSIEHGYFRSVFGFFGAGTFDDGEAAQALARVRQPVDRHVWVAPIARPKQKPLSSAWWGNQVGRDLRAKWHGQASLLRRELQPDLLLEPSPGEAVERFDEAMGLWAELQARRNYSLAHLRAFIKARLRHEGHELLATSDQLDQAQVAELQKLKSELRTERREAAAAAIASAPLISNAEADWLRRHQHHSPALQKRSLAKRLAIAPQELTAELVLWGDKWAGAAERLACLLDPAMAIALDHQRLKATTPSGQAALPWDQSYRAQRGYAAERIGLRSFIEEFALAHRSWSDDTPEVKELAKLARKHRLALQQGLGLSVRANDSDVALVNSLLLSFGITATSKRRGSTARVYAADPAQLEAVVAAANRLRQKASGQAPPSVGNGAGAYQQLVVEPFNHQSCRPDFAPTSPSPVDSWPSAAPNSRLADTSCDLHLSLSAP